jgi:hypothetical protein
VSHTIGAPWFASRVIPIERDGPSLPEGRSPKVRPVAGLGRAGLGRGRANEPAGRHRAPRWPGHVPAPGRTAASLMPRGCGAAGEQIPAGAEAPGLAPGPASASDQGRCSALRAARCARQCRRRHPSSPGCCHGGQEGMTHGHG